MSQTVVVFSSKRINGVAKPFERILDVEYYEHEGVIIPALKDKDGRVYVMKANKDTGFVSFVEKGEDS